MVGDERKFSLADAYAVETPDDSVQLYKDWADSYDEDFIAATGYVAFHRAAKLFLQQPDRPDGAVLDVGCGTGAVGRVLRDGGVAVLDGIDISQEMLEQAAKKLTADGSAVYSNLIQADLTETIAIESNSYAGIVSAGTFTHGHLGPECLDELWRVAAPGAVCSIGVNAAHFDSQGFADKFADDVRQKIVSEPDINVIDTFTQKMENVDEYSLQTIIVVCRVL